uniref:DNA/RNA-binding protein Alba-like domain-containing protein n=1 Tax=Daucus carota subsp. sativus TaxID=79200 RepID=A0A166DL94_DAUCS
MEGITEGVNNINIAGADSQKKSNRIQVSNTKKSLFFYVNLAKRFLQQYNEVELSALGMEIRTLTVDMRDEPGARPIPKAKIEILLVKTDKFEELMAAEAEEKEFAADGEEQN